jgi:hypothetical protein
MAHDVFISYSHVDKATADAACATLERNGVRCWIAPRDITPGDEWSAAIVKAIDQCRVMLLVFSASANDSRQIRREVERAINAGVTLVPVRIENVNPTESLAYFMSTVHWLDALTPPLDSHLQRLADSIKALLRVGTSQPAGLGAGLAQAPQVTAQAATKPVKKGMFAEIMNFAHRRTGLQAFGWYLMYLLIGVVLGMVSGYVAGIATKTFAEGFNIGMMAGQLSAIPYNMLLGGLLLWHREKDAGNVLLAIAGVVLAVILGALGGLIPLAFLSRRA